MHKLQVALAQYPWFYSVSWCLWKWRLVPPSGPMWLGNALYWVLMGINIDLQAICCLSYI